MANAIVIHGEELKELNDDDLDDVIRFGFSAPEAKYQMPNRKRTAPTTISPFNKSTTNLHKNSSALKSTQYLRPTTESK